MDTQTPDHAPTASAAAGSTFSRVFAERLLAALAAATPAATAAAADTAAWGEHWEVARELFESFHPRDAADAQLAAIAVAAAQSAMHSSARAARFGMSDEQAVHLRGSALAAGRAYDAALRHLRKRQPAAAQARPATPYAPRPHTPAAPSARDVPEVPPGFIALQPGAKPIPAVEMFQPRDRFGQPIPDLRTDLMTPTQLRASLTLPRNPALEAVAIAEEEAMIAEQAALDARGAAETKAGGSSG